MPRTRIRPPSATDQVRDWWLVESTSRNSWEFDTLAEAQAWLSEPGHAASDCSYTFQQMRTTTQRVGAAFVGRP